MEVAINGDDMSVRFLEENESRLRSAIENIKDETIIGEIQDHISATDTGED
ncbi:hypothetical protein M2A_0416 [Tepidicaulis marinus]|uniref:Uncharacterized protein n=1 Tax=Tepidicaulis marinus TaxID=1333998 RepID=A0A081B799_9HYPH|nr:hypothetical protein M2A_0416 [Tepidicaulis marinus]